MIRLKLIELTDLIDLMNASGVNFSQVPGFIDLNTESSNKSRANLSHDRNDSLTK